MSATDIFLSYARHDRTAARIFAESFAEEGFSVWWDASLHSGETFDEVIEQRLRDAKAVVVLWSPRSVASRWVRAEATLADRRNKLAPAIIEPCDRPIIFELTHAAELSDWTGDRSDVRWRTFVEDLRRLVDRPAPDTAAKPQPSHTPETGEQPGGHAPAVARQPLRPGHEDIIFADRAPREPAGRQPASRGSHHAAEPEAASEVHCLEMEPGTPDGELIVVGQSGAVVGRTEPADIVLTDKSVSRQHCIIGLANDELLVTDLNSTNGTYIDGDRIHRATVLPVGSVVRFGQIAMRHRVCTAEEAARRSGGANGDTPLSGARLAATR
jgi:hypothetical protein